MHSMLVTSILYSVHQYSETGYKQSMMKYFKIREDKCLKQNFGYFKDLMPHMVYDVS